MTDKDIDKARVTEQKLGNVVRQWCKDSESVDQRVYWCHNTMDRLSTELPCTGADNRTGNMWTEDFTNKADLYNWLKGCDND